MKKLKILICSPGSWSNVLNSPERGEGRWSQNYAKMLAMAGHEVYAASAGRESIHQNGNPCLIHESIARRFQPFDILVDAAWWQGKQPIAEAKKYIHIHWSLEEHIKSPLPVDHYIGYPYADSTPKFMIKDINQNYDRTFLMPTFFIEKYPEPKLHNSRIFSSCRDIKNVEPEGSWTSTVLSYINENEISFAGILTASLKTEFPQFTELFKKSVLKDGLPYNQVWDLINTSKVNVPLIGQSCTLDATFCGVPTLMWEKGGFFTHIAEHHGCLIKTSDDLQIVKQKLDRLFNDKEVYLNYLKDLQDYLSDHLYDKALEHFNNATKVMFE